MSEITVDNVWADYHTHSRYSRWYHASGTIDQMAAKAKKLGLKEIAITDHGPKHIAFGIKPKNFVKAKKECLAASQKYCLHVYMGCESNITGGDGTIDVTPEELDHLDILLMGYHKGTKCDFIKYSHKRTRNTPEQIQKNTMAYINAINKHNIAVVTHLNEYIKVDTAAVAKACAKRGTIIELNSKHLRFTESDVKAFVDSGVNFIVSSDAHSTKRVADVAKCIDFANKYNIPLERIKNINGKLNFLKPNGTINGVAR